jgi:hypothetical protein
MPPDGTVNIAKSPEDLRAKVNGQVVGGKPTFFDNLAGALDLETFVTLAAIQLAITRLART